MASKKEVEKRRVAAQQAAAAQERAATSRERKKRRTVGLVGGFLAIALVIPLAAGLITLLDDSDDPPELERPPVTAAEIRPVPAGEVLTGATPCPDTDGSQARTTSFEQAPGLCIDPALDYEVQLTTDLGEVIVLVDPGLDEAAANLFVTLARYGLYDDMPFVSLSPDGLAVTGDPGQGDAGFTIEPTAADGPAGYAIGSVIMFADLDGRIGSRFAFITTAETAATLEGDAVHPVVGTVIVGQQVIDALIAIGSSPETNPLPTHDLRIQSAVVTEVA